MRVFSIRGASYFCAIDQPTCRFEGPDPDSIVYGLRGRSTFAEGTSEFDRYRVHVLSDAACDVYLAASHFRRSLDLLLPSSIHWAHVTLYYGSYYSARALLSMFGCRALRDRIVQVAADAPGHQELSIHRYGSRTNQYFTSANTSHQRFWEAFYKSAKSISPFVDPGHAVALTPVSNNLYWLSKRRNELNYRTSEIVKLAESFDSAFSIDEFPDSLPGPLHSQFNVCRGLLNTVMAFANQFDIHIDAFGQIGCREPLRQSIRRHIFDSHTPVFNRIASNPDLLDSVMDFAS